MKEYSTPDFSYLLSPKSVAFIGGSIDANTIGGRVLLNLQKSHYKGKIFPVHPEYKEIFGMRAYPDLASIPEQVDTVVIVPCAVSILSLLDECEEKKVKFVILLTYFAGSAEERRLLVKALRAFSDRTGIRILGPDSFGLFNMAEPFGVSSSLYYEPNRIQNGRISLVTVDGGLGRAVLDASDRGIGFNYWICTGNEADLEAADFIKYMAYDSSTQVIFALVEGIKNKQKFRNAAEAANRAGKPLVVFNIEQPEIGVEDNQAGTITVADVDEMIDVGWLLVKHGIPAGNRIGIFAYSAGIKSLLANKCRLANLAVPDLTNKTKGLLEDLAPEWGVPANPILMRTSIFQNIGVFKEYLEIFANDPNLDVIIVPFPYKLGTYTEMMVRQTVEVSKRMNKPIIPLWTSLSGEMEASFEILVDSQIPFYRSVDACILAVKQFTDYYMNRSVLMKKHI